MYDSHGNHIEKMYVYTVNRLTRLNDGNILTSPFAYGPYGNLMSDVRSGISSVAAR